MGKRRASKHSAVAEHSTGGRLRRLLLAVLVGALAFVGSGALLESATVMTRVLIAVGSVLVVFTMVALAKVRRGGKSAGRRRAVAAATAVEAPVEVSEELVSD